MNNTNPLWDNDLLQFARLLCELVATQDNLNLIAVAEEMDVERSDVTELLERAHKVWEDAKTQIFRTSDGYTFRKVGDVWTDGDMVFTSRPEETIDSEEETDPGHLQNREMDYGG